MNDASDLMQYVQELNNVRVHLEFQVVQLTRKVKELEQQTKQEGHSQATGGSLPGEVHQTS